jgi:hypothetical protein
MKRARAAKLSRQAALRADGRARFGEDGKPEKLLIVDWDDTLLPTSYLHMHGLVHENAVVPHSIRVLLREYAVRVKATLDILASHGRVVIVTNAHKGWIELSCARFLPEIEKFIRSLPRISARPFDHEDGAPPKPKEWKEEAFVALAQMHYADNAVGQPVFSLGDASYEREAARRTAERLGSVAQSLKLLEHPSLEALDAQHAFLQEGDLEDLLGRRDDGFDLYFDVLDGLKAWSMPDEMALETVDLPLDSQTVTPKSTKSTISTATNATGSTTTSESAAQTAELSIHGKRCLKANAIESDRIEYI